MKLTNEFVLEHANQFLNDYEFYAKYNLTLSDKYGDLIDFEFNPMQKRLWNLVNEKLHKKQPIRFIVLKARQLGSSTFFAGLLYWLVSTQENRNGLIVAHDLMSSQMLGNKVKNYWLRSHKILKPNASKVNRSEIYFGSSVEEVDKTGNLGLDSRVLIQTADNPMLARSLTVHYALLSEAGLYGDLGISLTERMGPLSIAVPLQPNTAIILESTAKGEGEFSEYWYDENNGYEKIFVSWVADPDYRIEDYDYFELDDRPESRYGDEVALREIVIKELKFWYPENTDHEWLTNETKARLAWRRKVIDSNLNGDKLKFAQEYPSTPEDAFLYSSSCVFDTNRISELQSFIKENNIEPNCYRYNHDPYSFDTTNSFYLAKYGHLRMFEEPLPGVKYLIGADGAQGIDKGDHSSIVVLKYDNVLTEVASFNDTVTPEQFARIIYSLYRMYNNAYIVPERNDKGGFSAIIDLVNYYGCTNMYYKLDPLTFKKSGEIKWGWDTNQLNRSILISDTNSMLQNGDLYIYSNQILDQMKHFVLDRNGKAQASSGHHDDLVFALMLAAQGYKFLRHSSATIRQSPPKFSFERYKRDIQARQRAARAIAGKWRD